MSNAEILEELGGASCATRWNIVAKLGTVRKRSNRGETYYLDLRPYGTIWSHKGYPLQSRAVAERLLAEIQGKVASAGADIYDVLAEYLPTNAKPNLISGFINRWVALKQSEMEAGELSPTYIRELDRYSCSEGHFSWWFSRSIHEINYANLEEWSLWLAERGLGPKTRWNVMGAFRTFGNWLVRRETLKGPLCAFPLPKLQKHQPKILAPA